MDASQARKEYKFLLPAGVGEELRKIVAGHLPVDQDAEDGYQIMSDYFDSEDLQSYWQKKFGHPNRRRVRTRLYGEPGQERPPTAFVEVKHKLVDLTVKRRMLIDYDDIREVGQGHLPAAVKENDERVLEEIQSLIDDPVCRPVVRIRYHRYAFDSGPEGTLRVTFDTNPICRFPEGDGFGEELPVLDNGASIMEVKTIGNVPYWFREMIGEFQLVPQGFSKYTVALERYGIATSRKD